MRIEIQEIPEFYRPYFDHLEDESIADALERSSKELERLVGTISDEKAEYRYAEGKWSIKDVLQHLLDSERVFVYRAMRFSRNDATDLSGFEQNDYADDAGADERDVRDLLDEFRNLRASTILLFKSLDDEKLNRKGTANGYPMSVKFLGYLASAHLLHHLKVIDERYL